MIYVAATAAVWLCLMAVSASASSTLLSGYGGPGEGNQAILGSTLIGGGGKDAGGGGGSSSSTSSSSSSPSSIALVQTGTGSSQPRGRKGGGSGHATPSRAGHASKTAPPAYTPATASSQQAGGGRTLGLTGDDVVYIVLAFGALVLTALLTTRFAGRAGGAGGTQ